MALLGFFNELSALGQHEPQEVAVTRLNELSRSVNATRTLRPDFALQTQEPIKSWRFGGLTFETYLKSPDTKDNARVLLSAINRSPLRRDLAAAQEDDALLEYRFDGSRAEAVGLADLHDGLTFSFDHPPWQTTRLRVLRSSLAEDEDGVVGEVDSEIDVRNATRPADVTAHRPWIDRAGKPGFEDYAAFDANRSDRLANLVFLDNALGQLEALRPEHPRWTAIFARLDELQEALVEWDPAQTPAPTWRSKVTGEGETRRKLCNFIDKDGVTRCFDEHARFTPGMGRVYFRVDAGNRRLVIAHIGDKL